MAPVFIGDEVSAAGYRLAGARVRVCEPAQAEQELARALESASLVLVAARHAERVSSRRLEAALTAVSPLVLVVGDVRERTPAPDVGAAVRRELGVES